MSTGIYLDHIGIAVRDLALAQTDYARLGFTTTPLSLHASPPSPGAALEPSGSGNHCIMLEAGYIELLGITGPGKTNSAVRMLEKYEGAHILALGSKDAVASREAVAALGFAIAAPVALERDALWGAGGVETRRAAFANAYLDADAFPEAHTFVIEHKTPDVVWQAHQMVHENGAVGLVEAWVCAADPVEAAARFARLAGTEAQAVSSGEYLVRLERGRLRIMDGAVFAGLAESAPPAVPGMGGLVVSVRDVEAVAGMLTSRGVAFRRGGAGISVTGAAVHGCVVSFVGGRAG